MATPPIRKGTANTPLAIDSPNSAWCSTQDATRAALSSGVVTSRNSIAWSKGPITNTNAATQRERPANTSGVTAAWLLGWTTNEAILVSCVRGNDRFGLALNRLYCHDDTRAGMVTSH